MSEGGGHGGMALIGVIGNSLFILLVIAEEYGAW